MDHHNDARPRKWADDGAPRRSFPANVGGWQRMRSWIRRISDSACEAPDPGGDWRCPPWR